MQQVFNASKSSDMYESLDSHKKTQLEKLILWASVATVLGLVLLPYKKIDGNPVPTVIFKDNPSMFHGFILSLNFSFFGSFMAISLQQRWPRLARCCVSLAVVSAALGIAILGWLTVQPLLFKLEAIWQCVKDSKLA